MSQKPRHPEKVNKPFNPIKKKPKWIRSKMLDSQIFFQTLQKIYLIHLENSSKDQLEKNMGLMV